VSDDRDGRPATPSMTPFQARLGRVGIQWMTAMGIAVYRLSGGRVAGNVPSGAPICLLTTLGRRSGQRRCVPLLFVTDGDDLVVVASRGGMDEDPAWYLNLLAHPDVEIEVGPTRFAARARVADPDERARLWPRLVEVYPRFATYQERARRVIPVVLLRPQLAGR
jgi:deazaflavin-dependent oxidoreductase (nitroreductase family)